MTDKSNERGSGHGGSLRCSVCGRTVRYSDEQLIKFPATVWPTCCGETMTLTAGGAAQQTNRDKSR